MTTSLSSDPTTINREKSQDLTNKEKVDTEKVLIPKIHSPSLFSLLFKKYQRSSFSMYSEVKKNPINSKKLGNLFYYMKLMFFFPVGLVFGVWILFSYLCPLFGIDEQWGLITAAISGILAVNILLYKYSMLAWDEENHRLTRLVASSQTKNSAEKKTQ